jgi:drug/metabolite transporter (DMT)-like permease
MLKLSFNEALAVAISGQVLYHITQKLIAPTAHPLLSLLVFYSVASILCLPLFVLFPLKGALTDALGELNLAVVGVGVSIVLIELGFLLVYRAGGNLSTSFVVSASVTTAVMVAIGVFFLKEHFSVLKIFGVVLCVAGIALITKAE